MFLRSKIMRHVTMILCPEGLFHPRRLMEKENWKFLLGLVFVLIFTLNTLIHTFSCFNSVVSCILKWINLDIWNPYVEQWSKVTRVFQFGRALNFAHLLCRRTNATGMNGWKRQTICQINDASISFRCIDSNQTYTWIFHIVFPYNTQSYKIDVLIFARI